MSKIGTDEVNYESYLDEAMPPYFFCPGCGHGAVLDRLNTALVNLQLDPRRVVIVTDIGCSGLSDRYFITNAFHGLHGRSVTYATGIKLVNPDLKVIVLMGDGGCGIGGHHLINAARRNIGITVLVFNNLNYGMTGGEHSVTTPLGAITTTTPHGHLEKPMDICSTVAVNGASLVARTTAFDKGLSNLIAGAIQHEGFSLIDIWELCTAYYVPNNRFSRRALEDTLVALNFPTGILHRETRPEYSLAYRQAHAGDIGKPAMLPHPLEQKYASTLSGKLRCVIAGAAGQRIGSAAAAFCRGAVLSGLWATQRNDYPVTVRSGHSVSEVILGTEEIRYTGISKPDLVIALFPEGLARVRSQIQNMGVSDVLVVSSELPPVDTRARKLVIDFKKVSAWRGKKAYWGIMALSAILRERDFYPLEAFKEAVGTRPEYAQENLAAVEASEGLGLMWD